MVHFKRKTLSKFSKFFGLKEGGEGIQTPKPSHSLGYPAGFKFISMYILVRR